MPDLPAFAVGKTESPDQEYLGHGDLVCQLADSMVALQLRQHWDQTQELVQPPSCTILVAAGMEAQAVLAAPESLCCDRHDDLSFCPVLFHGHPAPSPCLPFAHSLPTRRLARSAHQIVCIAAGHRALDYSQEPHIVEAIEVAHFPLVDDRSDLVLRGAGSLFEHRIVGHVEDRYGKANNEPCDQRIQGAEHDFACNALVFP